MTNHDASAGSDKHAAGVSNLGEAGPRSADGGNLESFEKVPTNQFTEQVFELVQSSLGSGQKLRILSTYGLSTMPPEFFDILSARITDGLQVQMLLWMPDVKSNISPNLLRCIDIAPVRTRRSSKKSFLDVRAVPPKALEAFPITSSFVCLTDSSGKSGSFLICVPNVFASDKLPESPDLSEFTAFRSDDVAQAVVARQLRLFDGIFDKSLESAAVLSLPKPRREYVGQDSVLRRSGDRVHSL